MAKESSATTSITGMAWRMREMMKASISLSKWWRGHPHPTLPRLRGRALLLPPLAGGGREGGGRASRSAPRSVDHRPPEVRLVVRHVRDLDIGPHRPRDHLVVQRDVRHVLAVEVQRLPDRGRPCLARLG